MIPYQRGLVHTAWETCWKIYIDFGATYAAIQMTSFSGQDFFILHSPTAWLEKKSVGGKLACRQPRPVTHRKHLPLNEMKMQQRRPNSWTAEYRARMRNKIRATGLLDSQVLTERFKRRSDEHSGEHEPVPTSSSHSKRAKSFTIRYVELLYYLRV